ncbi:Mov34/MPN/PAD-1 family protein [Flavobacterium subsaxonicum]|uniref:Mov34/MPN/PAD-1 family protein n=1 Tax=Flavobacterium subsaxonicum TaxID=426226 RepID=UPI0006848291|nr:Mov34/MPN/PAD-1 family protein [Flavobacterium subsaxonicum]
MRYKIWIKNIIINDIFSSGLMWSPLETGGILMGYRVSLWEFVITDLIGPGEDAVHNYNTFQPDQLFHQSKISEIYKESNQLITYLGDWHTHPNSYSYLSCEDKKTISKIANHKEARLQNPLMIVAAPPMHDIKVWVYHKVKLFSAVKYIEAEIVIFD